MTYQEEAFPDFIDDGLPLMVAHHKEIDLFGKDLDIDLQTYIDCNEIGTLKIYTIRDESKLVGYCAFFLFQHPHHKTSLQAKQDVLFIDKTKRGRGIPFLRYCETELKGIGVDTIHQCVPQSNDWGKLLERMGYHKLETIYTRSL